MKKTPCRGEKMRKGGEGRGECWGVTNLRRYKSTPGAETLLVQSKIGGFVSGERVKTDTTPRIPSSSTQSTRTTEY